MIQEIRTAEQPKRESSSSSGSRKGKKEGKKARTNESIREERWKTEREDLIWRAERGRGREAVWLADRADGLKGGKRRAFSPFYAAGALKHETISSQPQIKRKGRELSKYQ